MSRYLNSFFITIILYLIAVFFCFFVFADSVIIPEKKEEKIISLNHIKITQQEPIPQSESQPIEEKVIPEPIIENKIHKPKKEKKHKQKKREYEKTMEEPKIEVIQNTKLLENTPILEELPNQINTSELEDIEALYLSQLRAKIEKNKVYPNSAKRLNQKGKVYVTFTISKDGQITNIKISKSSDFGKLDEAALKIFVDISTIEPIPKELNKNYWEITVPIVYQIK